MRRGGVARGASEGVHVPQVHAFNILRAAFQDKELSTETTGFAARGMEVSIRAFSSPHWEVRANSRLETCLVFLFLFVLVFSPGALCVTTASQSPVSIATLCPFRSTRSLKNRYSRSRPRSNGSRGLCFSQSDARRDVLRNVPAGAGAGDASAEPSRPPPNASPPHIGDVRRPTSIHTPSFTHPRVRTPSFTHTLVHTPSPCTSHPTHLSRRFATRRRSRSRRC